jgi:hypothetical protein
MPDFWQGFLWAFLIQGGAIAFWAGWSQATETDRAEDMADPLHIEWDDDRDRPVWEMVDRHRTAVANPLPLPYPRLRIVRAANESPSGKGGASLRETPGRAGSDNPRAYAQENTR